MKPLFTALIGWMALNGAALAQTPQVQTPRSVPTSPDTPSGPRKDGFGDAVIAPLGDFNLNQTPIPPALLAAELAPYSAPAVIDCETLTGAIAPLDEALGADLDTPPSPLNPGLLERGSVLAGDAAISAVRGATEGLVPFRSWVRKLTGAEAHSKKVRAAIAAGAVKRAYLKGLGAAKGCAPPAAPLPPVPINPNKP
jgi:hypothetical protein